MNLSSNGLNFIKQWERYKAQPYDDGYGNLTIGYGHVIRSGESYTSLTEPEASQLLAQDVAWAESAVNRNVYVQLTQSMFDALVSLVFNWGETNFVKSSQSALQPLNRGDYWSAAAQLASYPVTAKGIYSQGLVNRRAAESKLFLQEGLPTGETSVAATGDSQAPPSDDFSSPSSDYFGDGESSLLPLLAVAGGILVLIFLIDQ